MKRILYISFRITHGISRWIRRHFTRGGLLVVGCLVASAAVGLDTKQSVAYQIFTFVLSVLVLSMLFALVFRVRLSIRRVPPRYGTVDQPLSYSVLVKNQDRRGQRGLIISEGLDDSAPGFDVFKRAREPREGKRNIFDRTVGYHRWLWLNAMKRGALHREQVVPDIPPGGEVEVRVEMMPTRRGIRLSSIGSAAKRPKRESRTCARAARLGISSTRANASSRKRSTSL